MPKSNMTPVRLLMHLFDLEVEFNRWSEAGRQRIKNHGKSKDIKSGKES
jgi:hypothetical protein